MANGDKVRVLIDEGQRSPREEVVTASTVGGSVAVFTDDATTVEVRELTRGGTIRRKVLVNRERLIAVIEEPRGR